MMCDWAARADLESADCEVGPAFTLEEHAAIRHWAELMRPRGLRVVVFQGYQYLEEALHVVPRWSEEPRWLVFKTPAGEVAMTFYPGIASMTCSIGEALRAITAEVDAADYGVKRDHPRMTESSQIGRNE